MKTNKVEHCRWCLWNKSRLQIFRIRNRRRRIRRISRQNKYRKKFSRIFLQWYRSNDITTPVLSRPIYFLSQKNCNDEEDWPVNGRTSTVCLKNISVLDVCTENGTRKEKEKVTRKSWIFSPFAFRLLPSTFRFDSLFLFLSFFLERKESREPIECLVTVFKVRAEFRRLLRGQNGRMFGIEIDPVFSEIHAKQILRARRSTAGLHTYTGFKALSEWKLFHFIRKCFRIQLYTDGFPFQR